MDWIGAAAGRKGGFIQKSKMKAAQESGPVRIMGSSNNAIWWHWKMTFFLFSLEIFPLIYLQSYKKMVEWEETARLKAIQEVIQNLKIIIFGPPYTKLRIYACCVWCYLV